MEEIRYRVPLGVDVGAIASVLDPEHVVDEGSRNVQRTYLDTFDWRVHNAGGFVERERVGRKARLTWRTVDGALFVNGRTAGQVRFARDLPDGPLRHELAPVLDVRALLPMATVEGEERTYRVLDDEEKTVARVLVERLRVHGPAANGTAPSAASDEATDLGAFVLVRPLRGYAKEARKIGRKLARSLHLEAVDADLFETAMRALDRQVGDYSSKLHLRFDPTEKTERAVRRGLLELLEMMERNVAGMLQDLDPEFLHDFRVAGRRTRSMLGRLKGLFPVESIHPFKEGLAWLSQISSLTRDLDVWLLEFDDYAARLPEELHADLEPLREFLAQEQKASHRALAAELSTDRFARLAHDWRRFLGKKPTASTTDARRPVIDVARRETRRAHKRLIRDGSAIGPDTPAEALHELRKTAKKLRYLMEFFRSLFPASEIASAIKTLKGLQDNLGDFQDLEVQRDSLRGFGERMAAAGMAPPGTLFSMGMLLEDLSKRQGAARDEFADRFATMTAPKSLKLFHRLFYEKPKKRKAKKR